MREQLLGYLMGALEPAEQEALEARLEMDAELRRELAELQQSLPPLSADKDEYEPPADLAARTCQFVRVRAELQQLQSAGLEPSNWRFADLAVAAGICVAAAMLLFPAVAQSRAQARLLACQDNLRKIGVALSQYSDRNHHFLPFIPPSGNTAVAGIFGPTLLDTGDLTSPEALTCPASSWNELDPQPVPTLAQLAAASPAEVAELQKALPASYAYRFPYWDQNRVYRAVRNDHCPYTAIVADAPADVQIGGLPHHGACGQNMLFQDLHVELVSMCRVNASQDQPYLNDLGFNAAACRRGDTVLGSSRNPPVPWPAFE